MVFIDYKELIIIGIIALIVLYFLIQMFIISPIRAHVFGLRLYEYSRYGSNFYSSDNTRETKWYRSDAKALENIPEGLKRVSIIYPKKHERHFIEEQLSED